MLETAEVVDVFTESKHGIGGRGIQRRFDRLTKEKYELTEKYATARRDLMETIDICWQLVLRCEKQLAPADLAAITGGLKAIEAAYEEKHGR